MTKTTAVQAGLLDLVTQSGPVVQFVLFLLLFGSVLCWAVILTKMKSIRGASSQNLQFLDVFWKSKNLEEIFSKTNRYPRSPVAEVFKSGFKELKKLAATDAKNAGEAEVDNISRALSRAARSQIASMEKHIGLLATTASAAPFIGLFGTVWGIMNSFQDIGATGAANLAVVAPGISEALIATAVGLATAIPAVIAYNHFVNQIKRVATDIDCFNQDFLNIISRSFLNRK